MFASYKIYFERITYYVHVIFELIFVLCFFSPKAILKFTNISMISTDFRYNLSITNKKNIITKFKVCYEKKLIFKNNYFYDVSKTVVLIGNKKNSSSYNTSSYNTLSKTIE